MDPKINIVLVSKLLEKCNCDRNTNIYSLIPFVDKYSLILNNHDKILVNAIDTLAFNKNNYEPLIKEKERIFQIMNQSNAYFSNEVNRIGDDKIEAELSLISGIFFKSFFEPIQFFIPHSSLCSGQWDFWDNIDYLKFKDCLDDNEFKRKFIERIIKNDVWKLNSKLEEFPLIIQKRLIKEKLIGKKLDKNAMIKALIIKMGENAKPAINYEIIDYAIRNIFTNLRVDKYIRIDREIEFLRRLESEVFKEIVKILKE